MSCGGKYNNQKPNHKNQIKEKFEDGKSEIRGNTKNQITNHKKQETNKIQPLNPKTGPHTCGTKFEARCNHKSQTINHKYPYLSSNSQGFKPVCFLKAVEK